MCMLSVNSLYNEVSHILISIEKIGLSGGQFKKGLGHLDKYSPMNGLLRIFE